MFKLIKRLILMIIGIVLIIVLLFAGIGYIGYKDAVEQISIEEKVRQLQENGDYVELEDMSTYFVDAIVAIEDHRFYHHGGIDYISLVRITLANLRSQEILGGGSTITQQLAKNFYFMENYNFTRKISEAFVAYNLEKTYDKDEILEMYINIIYYGDGLLWDKRCKCWLFWCRTERLNVSASKYVSGSSAIP